VYPAVIRIETKIAITIYFIIAYSKISSFI
jgi:hypothetical protein